MAGSEFDGLFTSLDAGFDATLAREEEAAAADLAVSLAQGRSLAETVAHHGPLAVQLSDGVRLPVAEVGTDHVATEGPFRLVVPLAAALLVEGGEGSSPAASDRDIVSILRAWARRGLEVRVTTPYGTIDGRLMRAGLDYLAIYSTRGERLLAPLGLVRSIGLVRGS